MNNTTILSPREDLIATIISRLSVSGVDYSKNLVVFPGKRPAHVLRKTLAEMLNTSYVPPRIFTIDQWISALYYEIPGNVQPKIEMADALSLLFDIHSTAKQQIGGSHYLTLDAFIPVGMKLVAEIEEVAMALLTDARLREAMVNLPFATFQPLAEYYTKFYAEVERRGFVTRSMMYRTVAGHIHDIDPGAYEQVMLAGFYAFTKAEQVIFDGLRERGNVSILFQDGTGLRDQLKKFHLPVETEQEHDEPSPRLHYITAPDLHGQVFSLAAQLQQRLERGEAINHRTAIILPSSEALFPLYHHVLSLIPQEQYNIALGYPITRTPAYGFLVSLMELASSGLDGTYSSSAYIKLLLHPYLKNIRLGKRSDLTRIIVHTIERNLAKKGFLQVRLEELEQDDELWEKITKTLARMESEITIEQVREHCIMIHDHTIRKFNRFDSVKHCMQCVIDILTFIFNQSTARLHPYFRPYVERLIEALEEISISLLAGKKFAELDGYFTFLRHILGGESVPFSGTPLNGVQVLGLLETRNLSFDTLFFLDANDDVVPGKPDADLLLPQQVRARLGLETYREREKLMEYYFNLAVSNAKEVYFFYTTSESGKKERSRFVEKYLWQAQQREGNISIEAYEQSAKYRVHLANARPEPASKTGEMVAWIQNSLSFSATALDTYNQCQLKFYYKNVLRLEAKEETADELDNAMIGNVVHDVLAEYFKPALDKILTTEMLHEDRLHHIVDDCFTKHFSEAATGTILLFKNQAKRHIMEFLEQYQKPMLEREQVRITDLERKIQIESQGYKFKGTIDRIEERGNKTIILDYKTGNSDSNLGIRREKLDKTNPATWHEAIQSFQLPMYMFLYTEETKKSIENITPAYLMLGKTSLDESIEVGIESEAAATAIVYRDVIEVMFNIIREILNPAKQFLPAQDLENQCPDCPYSAICGTQWTKTSKYTS